MKIIQKSFIAITLSLCVSFGISCSEQSIPNQLSESEKADGWELLFDGETLNNWHLYNSPSYKGAWFVANGEIQTNPNEEGKRVDLVSNQEYEDYEFRFEWRLAKEGNSGVFINVYENDSIGNAWLSGPEYQLLEDSHLDFDKPLKRAGCLYGFTPQKNFVNTKKTGEWNYSKIVQKGGQVKFYLNDVLTAEMNFNSPEWKAAIQKSSFKNEPQFGVRTSGKIALQDWANGVSFRNLKIKKL